MSFHVENPGMLTTVQDLGRWGYQAGGVPVSGAMDPFSLRIGNILLGNEEGAAALEMTLFGAELVFDEACCIALTGADMAMQVNGADAAAWQAHAVPAGGRVVLGEAREGACRGYLCVSGGIGVPPVMGSRSTYMRARMGGFDGRPLQAGDVVPCGKGAALPAGFVCPPELRPRRIPGEALLATDGPQADAFTEEGLATFYSREYTISSDADRMGYRFDGPEIARCKPADVVSDGICWGAVQVPGHGRPIVMMADRQTTGGYTKIAVLSLWSVGGLAQRLPGESARFRRGTADECVAQLAAFEETMRELAALRAAYRP